MDTHKSLNFIEEIVVEDLEAGRHEGKVLTRFPPEPNGYLHIGHAKSICLNFELAKKYGGKTNLRFDDTNPTNEDTSFVTAIQKDIKWLGYKWDETLYASDYFEDLYNLAHELIDKGLAYVDDSTSEQIAEMKGSPTHPGVDSPYRKRSIEENKKLFTQMKEGHFPDHSKVLRAKIDMSSPNMHFRDPILYRIKRDTHHRTGDEWVIFPMYDMAHGQSDATEGITHSLCTLEFRHHRPLYNWLIENLNIYPSRQIEFARLNLAYTIMSKRKLKRLVEEEHVSGWDDPRMPTLAGMRRRGYPPEAIRDFCDRVGIAKRDNIIDMNLLEFSVREELNKVTDRVMVVLDPLEVEITNFPSGDEVEWHDALNNPESEQKEYHKVPLTKHLYIEKGDFMIDPPKKYFRMAPGRHVRLKNAFIVECVDYDTDDQGNVTKVYCTYVENSRSGQDTSGVKAKGTLHWVSKTEAIDIEVRLYDRLFTDPTPDSHEDKDYIDFLNPDSLMVIPKAKAEPWLKTAEVGQRFQFLRLGYFAKDPDSTEDHSVFNRTVTLRDTWKKLQSK